LRHVEAHRCTGDADRADAGPVLLPGAGVENRLHERQELLHRVLRREKSRAKASIPQAIAKKDARDSKSRAWGIRRAKPGVRPKRIACGKMRCAAASVNTARRAYTIGQLLELGLFGARVFFALRFVRDVRRLARAPMLRDVGSLGFHDVDPLYDAQGAQGYATVQSNRHAIGGILALRAIRGHVAYAGGAGSVECRTPLKPQMPGFVAVDRHGS